MVHYQAGNSDILLNCGHEGLHMLSSNTGIGCSIQAMTENVKVGTDQNFTGHVLIFISVNVFCVDLFSNLNMASIVVDQTR